MISKLNAVPHTLRVHLFFLLNSYYQKTETASHNSPAFFRSFASCQRYIPLLIPPSRLSIRVSPLRCPPFFSSLPTPLPGPFHGVARGSGIVSRYPASPGYAKQRANNGPQTRSPTVSSSPSLFFLFFSLSLSVSSRIRPVVVF